MGFIANESYQITCSSNEKVWNGTILVSDKGLVLGLADEKIITGVYFKDAGMKFRVVGNDNYDEYYYLNNGKCLEKSDYIFKECKIELKENNKITTINLNTKEKFKSMCFASKCALLSVLDEPHMYISDLVKEKR